MQRRAERKSARGGRALLTGLVRCGRCGRTMRVCSMAPNRAMLIATTAAATTVTSAAICGIGIGGVRIDRAVAAQIVEAVSEHAIEAAIQAADQSVKADAEIRQALCRELEEARYDASLAARRYEVVDPTKRLVARELETRWNTALERVAHVEDRIARHDVAAALRPKVDRAALMALARDLPATWNAPGTGRPNQAADHSYPDPGSRVLDRDDATNEALVTIHWNGGVTSEVRVSRCANRSLPGRSPSEPGPRRSANSADNCGSRVGRDNEPDAPAKPADGNAWTTVGCARASRTARDRRFRSHLPRPETVWR